MKIRWPSFFIWIFCISHPNQVEHTWLKGKCMVEWLSSDNSDSLKVHINFMHKKLNYLFSILYKLFVVYETQLNQKNYNITFIFLIILIIKLIKIWLKFK
jgi:hypothetical protein